MGAHLAHAPRAMGFSFEPSLARPWRGAHAARFATWALIDDILPSADIRPRRQERPDRGCNGGAFLLLKIAME